MTSTSSPTSLGEALSESDLGSDATLLAWCLRDPSRSMWALLTARVSRAAGGLFFDMSEVIIYPLACPNGTHSEGTTCSNP